MTDIVERLREPVDPDDPDLWKVDKNRLEAADEIERLRSRLAVLDAQWLRLREVMDE
jgi:hypothetical protein